MYEFEAPDSGLPPILLLPKEELDKLDYERIGGPKGGCTSIPAEMQMRILEYARAMAKAWCERMRPSSLMRHCKYHFTRGGDIDLFRGILNEQRSVKKLPLLKGRSVAPAAPSRTKEATSRPDTTPVHRRLVAACAELTALVQQEGWVGLETVYVPAKDKTTWRVIMPSTVPLEGSA